MKQMWAVLPSKLKWLLLTMVIANIGSAVFQPFLALYVKELGASVAEVGLYFTIMAISPVAFRILGGWFSDSVGRVQTVALGSLAGLAGFAAMWLAPTWQWLIPGGLLMSLGRSLVGPSFRAYTAECAGLEMRAQVFGFTDSIFMICEMVGPPLGGAIAEVAGYRWLFAVAVGFMVVATVVRTWNTWGLPFRWRELRPATLKAGLGGLGALILGGGLLAWIFVVDAVRDTGFSLSFDFFALYQKEVGGLGEGQIGWLSSIGAVSTALVLMPAGRLSDRLGERKVMALGGVLATAGIVLFVNVSSFAGFVAALMLINVAFAFFGPAFDSLLSKAVPSSRLGLTYGLFATTISVAAMPAPVIGAQLWQKVSPQLPFYLSAAVCLLMVVPIWLKFRLPQPDAASAEPKVAG
jgi:MFS family permease